MFDSKLNMMRWNVTFTDYSAHASEKINEDYGEEKPSCCNLLFSVFLIIAIHMSVHIGIEQI